MKILDPIDIEKKGARILSDKGILSAINEGVINIVPSMDFFSDSKRLQPSTLDVKIDSIDEVVSRVNERFAYKKNDLVLPAGSECVINLTEKIDVKRFGDYNKRFVFPSVEGRSSVRRLGGFVLYRGATFIDEGDRSQIELGNYSCNDIVFEKGERVAQIFFRVDPFLDKWYFNYEEKELVDVMDIARSWGMGVEVTSEEELNSVIGEDYLKVAPGFVNVGGLLGVRASDKAYRMRKLNDGFVFKDRDKYFDDDLLESVDISNGYYVSPGEHLIIEVQEVFELSSHVGIRFWDNVVGLIESNRKNFVDMTRSIDLINLSDGWVDPGYKGGFSRQPKWNSPRFVKPGDIVGYGQVFFYPKGTGSLYGDENLGSQYNCKKEISFSK